MKTQIEGIGLRALIKLTSVPGWVLLAKPVISILFSRQRDLNAYSVIDASAMISIVYAVIAFAVGIKYISNNESYFGIRTLTKSPIVIFLTYSLYGVLSMLWSVAPALTGFRAFECISMMLLIIAVIQSLFELGSLRLVILWSLMYCTWDITFSIMKTLQWTSDILLLLGASQMTATVFFYMALYFKPTRWYNCLIIVMSILSMSTVAYIGMGLGLVSSFWTKGKTKVIAIAGAFILLLTLIAIGPYALVKNTIFFDKNEVSIEETSGRNHLMDATIDCVERFPFGLGFFAAEPYVIYAKKMAAISAHNSLFSAGMGLGIPGIILISLFFMSTGAIVFSKYILPNYRAIVIGCFSVAFLHCMGNPSIGSRVYGAWMPCMYMFVLICGMYIYGKYYELEESEYDENYMGNEEFS